MKNLLNHFERLRRTKMEKEEDATMPEAKEEEADAGQTFFFAFQKKFFNCFSRTACAHVIFLPETCFCFFTWVQEI